MTEAAATDTEVYMKAPESLASDGTSEERARTIQKLGLLDPNQTASLIALSGDEGDDDENSIADCNYADGQKTTGMKRKLRKWRKVMRAALLEICPDLGLDSQPDINPGLMKHILEEVRSLKSHLAYQHSNIVQLAHKTEMYRLDSEHKEQFIADLLQNCKGIRLDSEPNGGNNASGQGESDGPQRAPQLPPLPASLSDIQFGRSKDVVETLNLNPAEMVGSELDPVVVHPVDFSTVGKHLPLLEKQNEAARDVAFSHPAAAKPSNEFQIDVDHRRTALGSSSAAFLSNAGSVRCRGPTGFDITSHRPGPEFPTECTMASTSTSTSAPLLVAPAFL